ncbi:MAG TPA: serine/threonine-protein kinase [Acidimicrobiia bacterium]|nr:serine/threonine-protein kinase [Acidimicrobiia bacterium]
MGGTTARVLNDRYAVGGLLGRGAMGDVRAATDRVLGREVAVKLLRTELRHDPDAHDRFLAEARAAAALAHPNVVAVHDAGEDDGDAYLVMERLSGRTLADDLARGPLAPERACDIVLDVLAGLEAAHKAGIVHRDVKPGNVMWTDDGRVKVGDFGIATSSASEMTRTGEVIGTPAYLAPERIEGERATPRSDLFAVGVLLYHCLAGTTPFPGDTPIAVAFAISQGRVRALHDLAPDLPMSLVAVVERAMAHDPQDRYPSADAMATALAHVRADVVGADASSTAVAVAIGATDTVAVDTVGAHHHDPTVALASIDGDDDRTAVLPVAAPVASSVARPDSRVPRAVALITAVVVLLGIGWALVDGDPSPARAEDVPERVTTTLAPATTAAPAPAPLSPAPSEDDDESDDDDGEGRGNNGGDRGKGKGRD